MLQPHKITKNNSGVQIVEINPRSNDNHKKLLKIFWREKPFVELLPKNIYYLKNTLFGDLRKLAKIRNRASHAGEIITREVAKDVRAHILGKNAMLGQLVLKNFAD